MFTQLKESVPKKKDAQAKRQSTGANKAPAAWLWLAGVGFTFVVALLGYGLAQVPGFNRVGQLACAILIAVAYRQIWGYPEAIVTAGL